ncbi:MAG: DUF2946 family protein, partial [Bacteroidales bacterium]
HRYDTSTDRRTGAVRRAVMTWLGLLLIVFNVLGTAALPARAQALSSAEPGHIEICTAAGIVLLDVDGSDLHPAGGLQHAPLCQFCLPLAHAGASVPTAMAMPSAVPGAAQPVALHSHAETLLRPAYTAGAASPRAPPLS